MAHNDDCTVLSAAFPDGETISLSAGELKRLKEIALEMTPMNVKHPPMSAERKKAAADEEPKKGSRR